MKKAQIAEGDLRESREPPGSSNRSFARMLVDFLMDDLRWRVLSRPLCRDGTARGMSD